MAKKTDGVNKLVPNLGNKSKYVLHYKNLQLYLLIYDWLKICIDFNTRQKKICC